MQKQALKTPASCIRSLELHTQPNDRHIAVSIIPPVSVFVQGENGDGHGLSRRCIWMKNPCTALFLCLAGRRPAGPCCPSHVPPSARHNFVYEKRFINLSTTPIPNCEKDYDLYKLYCSLPIGVVLLDSRMKTLSANRKFRIYFPFHPEGPEGFCFFGYYAGQRQILLTVFFFTDFKLMETSACRKILHV